MMMARRSKMNSGCLESSKRPQLLKVGSNTSSMLQYQSPMSNKDLEEPKIQIRGYLDSDKPLSDSNKLTLKSGDGLDLKMIEQESLYFRQIKKVQYDIDADSLAAPRPEYSTKYIHKSIRAEVIRQEEKSYKKVLILYTSGSAGANLNLQIVRGLLQTKMCQNQYLFDYQSHESLEDKSFLISPEQENGMRILYKIQQSQQITHSINVTVNEINEIARDIENNYQLYDAFIVLTGEDAICMISTILSFMCENLSKLVIITGGFFPITHMRNDIVENLIQSFAVISLAQNFNDVIVVSRNKGFRANRSIKMKEGSLGSISSPNLEPLVSINIKIKFREHLFLPIPKEPFCIWTKFSEKVGIFKFHLLLTKEAVEYELNNPAYDGFVIQSFASNNLPDNVQILNLFKQTAEEKGKIFVTVAQSAHKVNYSSKKQYLEQFYIYFGGDMTTDAASAKLSYLLSKQYSRTEIKRLLQTNLRGELTEVKKENQFSLTNLSFMEIVGESIEEFYPTKKSDTLISEIENSLCKSVVLGSTCKQIEQLFKKTQIDEKSGEEMFVKLLIDLVNRNFLLHKAVKAENENLYKYFLQFEVDVNQIDRDESSPLFYAVSRRDKKAILYLTKKGGNVICPTDELFEMMGEALEKDDWKFFELLYHIEFKETLPHQVNVEGRNALHLAALLGAQKSLKYLMEKFKFNLKAKDEHGKTYNDYLKN